MTTSFKELPGEIGVSVDTRPPVLNDIVTGEVRQGFNNIVIFDRHVPNRPIISVALGKISNTHPEAGLYQVDWWKRGFDVIPRIR